MSHKKYIYCAIISFIAACIYILFRKYNDLESQINTMTEKTSSLTNEIKKNNKNVNEIYSFIKDMNNYTRTEPIYNISYNSDIESKFHEKLFKYSHISETEKNKIVNELENMSKHKSSEKSDSKTNLDKSKKMHSEKSSLSDDLINVFNQLEKNTATFLIDENSEDYQQMIIRASETIKDIPLPSEDEIH